MAVIFLTLFLDLVGFGIVLPLLPQFAKEHNAQEWQIGLLAETGFMFAYVGTIVALVRAGSPAAWPKSTARHEWCLRDRCC